MKFFCVNIDSNDNFSFYIKPETSVVRDNESIYVPLFTKDLRYDVAFAVKIGRVTKAIGEKFAPRCWDEMAISASFYAYDIRKKCIENGVSHEAAYAWDKSFIQPNNFIKLTDFEQQNYHATAHLNGETITLNWLSTAENINRAIAYLSNYLTLKMGDVVMVNMSQCADNQAFIGDRIELLLGNEVICYTEIK